MKHWDTFPTYLRSCWNQTDFPAEDWQCYHMLNVMASVSLTRTQAVGKNLRSCVSAHIYAFIFLVTYCNLSSLCLYKYSATPAVSLNSRIQVKYSSYYYFFFPNWASALGTHGKGSNPRSHHTDTAFCPFWPSAWVSGLNPQYYAQFDWPATICQCPDLLLMCFRSRLKGPRTHDATDSHCG